MKRKNYALKDYKRQVKEASNILAQARTPDEIKSARRAMPHPLRPATDKDIPAFVPGGGPGCTAHRQAKRFARTMGRSMRPRR